jgi:two-component system sensor histidine kinase HydH
MGVALLITSWSSYRGAQEAVSTLNRGQADVLFEAAQQALRGVAAGHEAAALDSLLANQESAGLRYAGLFDNGRVIAEAGSTIEPIVAPTGMGRGGPPPVAVTVGSRLRITSIVPRPRAAFADREDTRDTPPPDSGAAATGRGSAENRENRSGGRSGRGAFPQRQAAALILEFEPVVADQLTAQSAQTFGLAALGTVVLLAAALLFWRLSMVHEREQIRFEQQRRLGALGEMSAVLAHEIRNPLASLKGHAQLLAGRLAPASAERRKADRVVGEAKRLENLVTDLLAFTRSAPIARRPVDPARLLRSAVDEVGGDTFAIEGAGAPAEWSLDPDRIRQALTNLLRNAAQASPEGTTIETSVAAANGKLVFTVRDHGDGLRSGDEGRVFEPFYTTRTQGTGLGLAVASRIADMHDGSITAANHPGGGAIFRIEIPRS